MGGVTALAFVSVLGGIAALALVSALGGITALSFVSAMGSKLIKSMIWERLISQLCWDRPGGCAMTSEGGTVETNPFGPSAAPWELLPG